MSDTPIMPLLAGLVTWLMLNQCSVSQESSERDDKIQRLEQELHRLKNPEPLLPPPVLPK